jgi:hypothetical protein
MAKSTREKVLDRYAPPAAAGLVRAEAVKKVQRRGDVVALPGSSRRFVVSRVERIGDPLVKGFTWGVSLLRIAGPKDDRRLDLPSYTTSPTTLPVLGVWEGLIEEGAPGRVCAVPSDTAGTVPHDNRGEQPHDEPTGSEGEATMATVKTKAKKATTTAKKATTTAAKKATGRKPKFAPSKAEVTDIAKRLREGAKMNDIKAEHGLSNGQPVRKALLEHGFDSKGNKNPEGKTARELAAERRAQAGSSAKTNGGTKKSPAAKSRAKAKAKAEDPS